MGILIVIVIIVALLVAIGVSSSNAKKKAKQARKDHIYQKYGNNEIADKIINNYFWVGQTSEQLIDAIGQPLDIDEKILKTKKKEVWKYNRTGTNRYSLKITIENGLIVGWDKK